MWSMGVASGAGVYSTSPTLSTLCIGITVFSHQSAERGERVVSGSPPLPASGPSDVPYYGSPCTSPPRPPLSRVRSGVRPIPAFAPARRRPERRSRFDRADQVAAPVREAEPALGPDLREPAVHVDPEGREHRVQVGASVESRGIDARHDGARSVSLEGLQSRGGRCEGGEFTRSSRSPRGLTAGRSVPGLWAPGSTPFRRRP